jgi:quinol monooxygenase YgiN
LVLTDAALAKESGDAVGNLRFSLQEYDQLLRSVCSKPTAHLYSSVSTQKLRMTDEQRQTLNMLDEYDDGAGLDAHMVGSEAEPAHIMAGIQEIDDANRM